MLADAGLGEQDVARRIAEWSAVLAERTEDRTVAPARTEPAEGQQ